MLLSIVAVRNRQSLDKIVLKLVDGAKKKELEINQDKTNSTRDKE